jgi:hypothetical protein
MGSLSKAATAKQARGPSTALNGSPFVEAIGAAGDAFEREADRAAEAVVRGGLLGGRGSRWASAAAPDDTMQRQCADCEEEEAEQIRRAPKEAAPMVGASGTQSPVEEPVSTRPPVDEQASARGTDRSASLSTNAAESSGATTLLVEDDADVAPGQMRKSEFMAALRAEVCRAIDGALSRTGRDSNGCPYVDYWFGFYETRSAAQAERSLRRYASDVRGATAAADYIPAVTARIRRSAEAFAATGEMTGVPDDMPTGAMVGGGVLASFGGMFFKARPGGAGEANPHSVRSELGRGESLPGAVRTRMESAFGASFSHVRLHTDARSARISDRLNARAFAVGDHVAFGAGEFRPGTLVGDALIAHELAHVVQQGRAAEADRLVRAGGHTDRAMELDADGSAAGVVRSLWAPEQMPPADAGRPSLPRLGSGLRLQRCGGAQKKADDKLSEGKSAKLTLREDRDNSLKEASDRLRAVDTWASTEVKKQNVPSVSGVRNLDPEQAKNVAVAIEKLLHVRPLFDSKELDALSKKLDEVVGHAKEASKFSGSQDELQVLQGRSALIKAVNAADEASALVGKLTSLYDISKTADNVDAIVKALNDAQAGKQSVLDATDVVVKKVKESKNEINNLKTQFAGTPEAIDRIVFVLRSFLMLNAPGLTQAPSKDDVKKYLENAGVGLSGDLDKVFGGGLATMGFEVFKTYATVLGDQLKIQERMQKQGITPASPVPSQQNAEALFKSLKSAKNPEVLDAYMTYARAYFYHRVIDKFQDMQVTDVAQFYTRPLSIVGTRPLVCTGYALLGSHLLTLAGAKLTTFIVAIRATDDNLLSGNIDAGHAVARMTRNGEVFFVSNDSIVTTEKDAIGPDAVAWANSQAPRFDGAAGTIPAANEKAWQKMEARKKQLENRPANRR